VVVTGKMIAQLRSGIPIRYRLLMGWDGTDTHDQPPAGRP
jgi:hypothetical protein